MSELGTGKQEIRKFGYNLFLRIHKEFAANHGNTGAIFFSKGGRENSFNLEVSQPAADF